MPVDGRFPAVDETLTIDGAGRRAEVREAGADRAHVAHHVQLPVRLPFLVRHLLEPSLPRDPDVVDEAVEPAERGRRLSDQALGLPRLREIAGDVPRLADARLAPGCVRT